MLVRIVLVSLLATPATALAADFLMSGACPGAVELTGSAFTPDGRVAIAKADNLGSYTLPSGTCAGTTLDLDNPGLLRIVTTDSSGGFTLGGTVPIEACGQLLQAVDLTTCRPTRLLGVTTQESCTITMDAACPDTTDICGATFSGGDGCVDDSTGFCHDSGDKAYRIDDGQTVRIELADELNSWAWFLAATDGGVPLITTYDRDGVEISTSGQAFECDTSTPPASSARPWRPVQTIEITGNGGTTYLDSLKLN